MALTRPASFGDKGWCDVARDVARREGVWEDELAQRKSLRKVSPVAVG